MRIPHDLPRLFGSLLLLLLMVRSASGEPLSSRDLEEIARLRTAQGRSAEDVAALVDQAKRAGERGLPAEAFANKIKEGLAKGVEPKRIESVLGRMIGDYEQARDVLKEAQMKGVTEGRAGRRTLDTLAEAIARGATADEVRNLGRSGQGGGKRIDQDALASGAKGLALMKEAGISAQDGADLIGEGLRRGLRSSELIDLGREVKRRGRDFREGRTSLQRMRERLARGERGEGLFRDDDRSGRGRGGDRIERIDDRADEGRGRGRSESGDNFRPERVDRGDSSGRSDRGERPERPDRSGRGGGRD